MEIEVVYTEKAPKPIGPYSQAVFVKELGLIFISGQIGISPETGKLVSDDIAEQTKQTLENLKAILEKARARAVDVTVFLINIADFQKVNEIYAAYFDDKLPARAVLEVSRLPAGAKIEIKTIAAIKRWQGGKKND